MTNHDEMTMDQYQLEAARTLPRDTPLRDTLALGALGLAGEAGEAVELVKKHLFHGQPLDRERFTKELGDVLWYLAACASAAGLTLDHVAKANVAKLRARYPEGFTPAASVERKDEHEPRLPARTGYKHPEGHSHHLLGATARERALAVSCPVCPAPAGIDCYEHGVKCPPHNARIRSAS